MQVRHKFGHRRASAILPVVIRDQNQALTDSYVVCAAAHASGNILVASQKLMTLWALPRFESADSFEIQVRYVLGNKGVASLTLTDLASVNGSAVVTSTTGGWTKDVVGRYLHLTAAGTNGLVGIYRIVAFTSSNSITVDRDIAGAGNMSGATGTVYTEAFECAIDTPSGAGASNLYQHEIVMTAADHSVEGWKCFTLPVPGASIARVYAKATGTVTSTDLVLAYTTQPEGGE